MRIYQGTLAKGELLLQRPAAQADRGSAGSSAIHADQKEDIDSASRRRHRRRDGRRVRHRRHLLLEGTDLSLESIFAAEPVIDLSIQPRQAGRLRQARQGPQPLHARGPDLPRARRPRDQRDDHLRHGRAAPGDLRRADAPRVQGRLHRRRAQGELPRGADQARRRSTTSTRSRPAARASTPTSSAS